MTLPLALLRLSLLLLVMLAAAGSEGIYALAPDNPPPAKAAAAERTPKRSPKGRAAPKTKPKDDADTAADEATRRAENEARRQAFFKKTGVWLWPELTEAEQEEAVDKQKEFLGKVTTQFGMLNLRPYETQYFIFLSDLPPAQVAMYVPCLDKMYQELSQAFGIAPGTNIWLGKAVIIAFERRESFFAFEPQFFQTIPAASTAGLAHLSSQGAVVISCHCNTTPKELAAVIVHETAHGFVHRYRSAEQLPTWLNEGIAEWIAAAAVPADDSVRRKQQQGLQFMRQQHNMGGNFFVADRFEVCQYGIAASMTGFLIRSNPKAFRELIESIKSGEKWPEALKNSYGVTPQELAIRFGMSVGIANLGP